ncbi:hypothetical protein [Streptomyces axinellae]|uniref:Lipoprotein n=1 Tax=Streptomyces axinellae TaxID=552788 RepID=A0ABP6DEF2_9ACTN
MNRRTTCTRTRIRRGGMPAVLAATGALLLGACGGDGGGSSDEIKGADKGGESPSASASASKGEATDDGIKRPVIKLGKGAENVFEKADTGDPVKDGVLADAQRGINASDQVITRHKGVKTLEFYSKKGALLDANNYVKGWVEDGRSWVGKVRYYDWAVELQGEHKATVKYCIDQSGGQTKLLKSGKLLPNNGGKKNFGYATSQMERNKEGVWQEVSGDTEPEAERCMK